MDGLTRRRKWLFTIPLMLLLGFGPAGFSEAPLNESPVAVAVIGDYGCGCPAEAKVAERMAQWLRKRPFGDIATVGDNIYGRNYPAAWRFLLPGRKGGGHPALFPERFDRDFGRFLEAGVRVHAALGNHDARTRGGRYEIADTRRFGFGGPRGYYSWRLDSGESRNPIAEFFVLNTVRFRRGRDRAQLEWLVESLRSSRAAWKVVYFHHPIVTPPGGHRPLERLGRVLIPLFRKHGVDVVWQGHNHFYARSRSVRGVYYFVTGNGGAPLRRPRAESGTACRVAAHGFMVWEFTLSDARFFEVAPSGRIPDRGRFVKTQGRARLAEAECSGLRLRRTGFREGRIPERAPRRFASS